MKNEQKFINALESIFVGAKIEGQSGYVNLMNIKTKYFEEIKVELLKLIDKKTGDIPYFREELFDKLYNFFSRYFSRTGSVYFTYTPFNENIYERVYKNDEDVALFWKTHMLYYVKSDVIYQSIKLEVDNINFFFDVSKLEHKQNNEKRKEIIFDFNDVKKIGNQKTIVLDVMYSKHGKITKPDDILKNAKKLGVICDEDTLNKAIRVFEQQSEVDYFINKNAKAFLEEQFDLWMYQHIFKEESMFTEKRIEQLQVLKNIAYAIIAFIAQFENELVKIWNKPKFVLNSNYVITKDKILEKDNGDKVLKKLLESSGIEDQIKEWHELNMVDDGFKKQDILDDKYKHLPFDTKYFKDVELDILGLFDNLDKSLDGWLIHSENYQALNTILPKYKEKTQTIYIDPPFKTGSDFIYIDKFEDSTWLSLMNDRLELAKKLLRNDGSFYLHLDYNADYLGRLLTEKIFSHEGFRNKIVWQRSSSGKTVKNNFINDLDFILFFTCKQKDYVYNQVFQPLSESTRKMYSKNDNDGRGFYRLYPLQKTSSPGPHTTYDYIDNSGKVWKCPKKGWRMNKNKLKALENDRRLYLNGKTLSEKAYWNERENQGVLANNLWNDISNLQGKNSEILSFDTQKPEKLLQRIIESSSNEGNIILDFFVGSGTTIVTAHKMNRKWIGIEMGEHFKTTILPRLKETLNGVSNREPCGISEDVGWQGGGFFKYYQLEQYEDTLRNMEYEDSQIHLHNANKSPFEQYVFLRDEKMAKCVEVKENDVEVDLNKIYPSIDVAETLSNLTGKWVKRITKDYVEFEDGTKESLNNPGYKLIKPLIWW